MGTAFFTAELDAIPDPAVSALETMWEEEWEKNLMDAAIANVKREVNPKQFRFSAFTFLRIGLFQK
jgi:hypothetical protein